MAAGLRGFTHTTLQEARGGIEDLRVKLQSNLSWVKDVKKDGITQRWVFPIETAS